MVKIILLILLTAMLSLHPSRVTCLEGDENEKGIQKFPAINDANSHDLMDETEAPADREYVFRPREGSTDDQPRKKRPQHRWLPPEEATFGIPQSATGGGFPDRSMRTGTFAMNAGIPGAGGTRAGR